MKFQNTDVGVKLVISNNNGATKKMKGIIIARNHLKFWQPQKKLLYFMEDFIIFFLVSVPTLPRMSNLDFYANKK